MVSVFDTVAAGLQHLFQPSTQLPASPYLREQIAAGQAQAAARSSANAAAMSSIAGGVTSVVTPQSWTFRFDTTNETDVNKVILGPNAPLLMGAAHSDPKPLMQEASRKVYDMMIAFLKVRSFEIEGFSMRTKPADNTHTSHATEQLEGEIVFHNIPVDGRGSSNFPMDMSGFIDPKVFDQNYRYIPFSSPFRMNLYSALEFELQPYTLTTMTLIVGKGYQVVV